MKRKDGQKVLYITYLSFFLPEDFEGDLADAFECLAAYHRMHKNHSKIVKKPVWKIAWKNFIKENKRVTASLSLSRYNEDKNEFERIDPPLIKI